MGPMIQQSRQQCPACSGEGKSFRTKKEREVLESYTRHSHLINHWKRAALKGLDDTSDEQKIDELLEKIGTDSAERYFQQAINKTKEEYFDVLAEENAFE